MPDLLVRNLSEQTALRLRERAARHKRSVQAEAAAILEAGTTPNSADLIEWLRGRKRAKKFDVRAAVAAVRETAG